MKFCCFNPSPPGEALHVGQVQSLDTGGVQQLVLLGDQDLQPVHQHLFTQHTVWQGCGGRAWQKDGWMEKIRGELYIICEGAE